MFEPLDRRRFFRTASKFVAGGLGVGAVSAAAAGPVERVGGPKLKTSLNAFSFNLALRGMEKGPDRPPRTLFEVLEFCAEHNFDAIDPTAYYFPGYPEVPPARYLNEFKRRAFQLGLDISGTGVKNNFASPDPASRAADVELVRQWIEVAAKMGAPVIRVFAGPVPEGYENKWDEVASWMVDALRQCAERGEEFGVLVGVQNHGDMLKTAAQTLEVVERVDSDWFGVIVDTGYFHTPDPYVDLAAVIPHAVNFQVKESPFGKASPIRTDLDRLIRLVRASGYRGYLPIETLAVPDQPYDPREQVPAFLAALKAALAR